MPRCSSPPGDTARERLGVARHPGGGGLRGGGDVGGQYLGVLRDPHCAHLCKRGDGPRRLLYPRRRHHARDAHRLDARLDLSEPVEFGCRRVGLSGHGRGSPRAGEETVHGGGCLGDNLDDLHNPHQGHESGHQERHQVLVLGQRGEHGGEAVTRPTNRSTTVGEDGRERLEYLGDELPQDGHEWSQRGEQPAE